MSDEKSRKVAEKLRESLSRRFDESRIANEDTDLVVEGFPRSANTFCVEFIDQMVKRQGRTLRMVHHLHSAEHLKLGSTLGVPCLALIREPVDAITSFCLYMDYDAPRAAGVYVRFYKLLLQLQKDVVIADFALIHKNMNVVIEAINEKYPLDIPFSADVTADSEEALRTIAERSKKTHGKDKYTQKAGVPLEERGKLKEDMKPRVEEYLGSNDDALATYHSIQGLGSYLGG